MLCWKVCGPVRHVPEDVCPRLSGSNRRSKAGWRWLPGEMFKHVFKSFSLHGSISSKYFITGNKIQRSELSRKAERFCSGLGGRVASGGLSSDAKNLIFSYVPFAWSFFQCSQFFQDLDMSDTHSMQADLSIVLGSTLQVLFLLNFAGAFSKKWRRVVS